jgi:hypothetical protein
MTNPIPAVPVKLAAVAMLASLPVLYWAADRADHSMHFATAASTSALVAISGFVIGRGEPVPGLESARRTAARHALLMGLVYLWGSLGMLVSYYLTDLAWYHTYQYAAYLAVPGLVSLYVSRRHQRAATDSAIRRDLDTGRRMAWLQLGAMLIIIAYMLATEEASLGLVGEEPNWAAVDLFLCGAIALAVMSVTAAFDDRRLRS